MLCAMEHAGLLMKRQCALFDVEIVMIDLKQHGAAQNIDHFNLRMPVALQGSGGIAGENDALRDEWKLAASVGNSAQAFFSSARIARFIVRPSDADAGRIPGMAFPAL